MAGIGLGLAAGALLGTGLREGAMDVRLAVRTDRSGYAPGDTIQVELTVTNAAADTAVLRFATGQRFDIEIQDSAGVALWRWGEGRMFMQMLGQVRVPPGETVTYRTPVEAPARAGRYVVIGRIVARDAGLKARAEIVVEP